MAEQCPQCGCDLDDSGSCAACGYGSAKGAEADRKPLSFRLFLARLRSFALPLACGALLSAAALAGYLRFTSMPREAEVAGDDAPPAPYASRQLGPIGPEIGPIMADAATVETAAEADGATAKKGANSTLGATLKAAEPKARNAPPTTSGKEYVAWMLAHTTEAESQLIKKWERALIIRDRKDLTNEAVLQAFLYAPREFFARRYNLKKAYDDTAIPIGHGQTISGPNMVSAMTNAVAPLPGDRILEIGTGSGYQSSLLAELSDSVYTIEIVAPLYAETDAIYKSLEKRYPEYKNIVRVRGDGYFGLPEHAPFQKIIVTAGIDHIPPPLLRQLAPGGVMVIPVGPPSGQTILKIVKTPSPDGGFAFTRQDIYHGKKVIFVPFTSNRGGAHSLRDSGGGKQQ